MCTYIYIYMSMFISQVGGACLAPNSEEWWGFDTTHVAVGDVHVMSSRVIQVHVYIYIYVYIYVYLWYPYIDVDISIQI